MSEPEPPPLYHGTRRGFRGAGGIVVPGNEVGADNHGLGRSDRVYVTPDLDMAKDWAEAAKGRGRAKVLQVRPHGALEVDDSTVAGQEHEAYRCEWATVVAVVWREGDPEPGGGDR